MKPVVTLMIALFLAMGLSAQYRVTRCSELSQRPLQYNDDDSSTEILAIYLKEDADSGVGGLDCWVFHHENNKDYVVTPRGWYPNTRGPRERLIRDAMDAITDSRRKYIEYGTMDKSLYYILNDIDYGETQGEKFWMYEDDQCWMRSGVPTLEELNSDQRKQVFAHEIGHCFVEENVPKTAYTDHDWDEWFDESVAEYLSSEVYKTVNQEHQYAEVYNFDAPFMQPYNAYVLWYYYAKKNGIGSVVPLMNQLTGIKTQKARLNYLRSVGFDQLFHNFLFDFTTREIKDSGTGESIPGPGDIFDEEYTLETSQTEIVLPEKIRNAQREFYWIEIPSGFNVTLYPPSGSSMTYFQSLMTSGGPGGSGKMIKNWSSPEFIQGDCNRTKIAMVMVSHLNTEILGNLNLRYELEARADCCSGVGETLNGCLIGTWEVDVSTVSHLIDYDVSGTLKVTFENIPTGYLNADFQLRFDFDNGDHDIHKGTVSACVVPDGTGGHLNYFRLFGVSLGPGNIHKNYNSRTGEMLDATQDVIEGLNDFRFNYTTCSPEELIVLYLIQMSRVQ